MFKQPVHYLIYLFMFCVQGASADTDRMMHEVEVEARQLVPAIIDVVPHYPGALLKRGVGGKVTLDYEVDKRGKARNFRVIEAEPSRAFVRSAMIALKKSRFSTPVRDGRPVSVHHQKRSYIYSVSEQGPSIDIR